MKPGKPVMFATLTSTAGRSVPVFGLPGNPVSVMVAFEQFVRPALLQMQGRRALRRVTIAVRVDAAFKSPAGKVEFVRARVLPERSREDQNGEDGNREERNGEERNAWRAYLAGEQSSGRLSTMTQANALLVVPAAVTRVEPNTLLTAQMTDWPEME